MAKFYLLGRYSKEGLTSLLNNPDSDRGGAAKTLIESMGGTFISYDFLRGHYDFIACFENMDFEKTAAVKTATMSSGMMRAIDIFEAVDMNKIAADAKLASSAYKKPGE